MKQSILNMIERLETYKITLNAWLITFFSIAFLRTFLEFIIEKNHTIGWHSNVVKSFNRILIMWNLEWITLFAVLILIFYIFTKENIIRISKITLFFYIWIILPVILDLFIYFPEGSDINYLFTVESYIIAIKYFFFFTKNIDVSMGVRLEVLGAVILTFSYIIFKTGSKLRSFLASVLVYFFAVSSMAFPVFVFLPAIFVTKIDTNSIIKSFFNNDSIPFDALSKYNIIIFLLLFACIVVIFRAINKKNFFSFTKTLFNHSEPLIYPASILLGLFTFKTLSAGKLNYSFFINLFDYYLIFAFIILGLLLSIIKVLVQTSKTQTKNLKTTYTPILTISILLTLFLSLSLSYHIFLIVLMVLSLFFLIYKSPYASYLKKFNKAPISAVILVLLLFIGFSSIAGSKAPQHFNLIHLVILYFFFTSFEYLKSVNTKTTKIIWGILNIISFAVYAYFLQILIMPICLFFSFLLMYFSLKRDYKKSFVLVADFSMIVIVVSTILLSSINN